jgi:hypothetical protein
MGSRLQQEGGTQSFVSGLIRTLNSVLSSGGEGGGVGTKLRCLPRIGLVANTREPGSLRAKARQGNWQPQRNRNFRVEHMLLIGAAQLESIQ